MTLLRESQYHPWNFLQVPWHAPEFTRHTGSDLSLFMSSMLLLPGYCAVLTGLRQTHRSRFDHPRSHGLRVAYARSRCTFYFDTPAPINMSLLRFEFHCHPTVCIRNAVQCHCFLLSIMSFTVCSVFNYLCTSSTAAASRSISN